MIFGFWMINFTEGFLLVVTGGYQYNNCQWTNDGDAPAWPNANNPIFNVKTPSFCPGSYLVRRYGALIAYFTWAAIAIQAGLTVIFKRELTTPALMITTIAVIVLLPIPLIFPEAYLQAAIQGASIGGPVCIVQSTNPALSVTPIAQWVDFTTPTIVCIAIGSAMLVVVLVQTLRVTDITSSYHIVNNIRLLLFMTFLVMMACTALGYFIHVYNQALPYLNSLGAPLFNNWTMCTQASLTPADFDACVPLKPFVYNVWYWGWFVCCYGVTSIAVNLMFLTQKDLWTNWNERLAPWKGLWMSIATWREVGSGSATTTTAAGSSSSSGSATLSESTMMSDLQ
jgi:hypothetical protein